MNFKVFSLLAVILLVFIAILGGTYYYLFENSTPQSPSASLPSNTSSITSTPSQSYKQDVQIQTNPAPFETQENRVQTSPSDQEASALEGAKEDNSTKSLVLQKEDLRAPQEEQTQDTNPAKQNPLKLVSDSQKTKSKLSTIKEYQQRGKDSRLEPQLSSETIKVYVVDGKALSDYRINLLKDMLKPVQNRSKDYNLSVFIEMLPQSEMSISIYNKDIIFSERKKSYKHISMDKLKPYLDKPEELNQRVKREEAIERVNFQLQSKAKGSAFSKHIKSLKNGLERAQYFFPFCEIIYIDSKK